MAGLPVEINPLFLSSSGGYTVGRSLRFRSSASAYLNRTPAAAGSLTTMTFSAWVKLSTFNAALNQWIWGAVDDNYGLVQSVTSNSLTLFFSGTTYVTTSAVFRDPSAWYHIVATIDTTNATSTNRLRLYVNGVLQTIGASAYPAQNATGSLNSNVSHNIGRAANATRYWDGYLAEVNFIDGQALTPSSFGAYDTNGVWQPIKYTGTYGTNGFYLPFSDNSAATPANLGKDFSGTSSNVIVGSSTNASTTLTVVSISGISVGNIVTGPGIPNNTYVTAVGALQVTLSQAATSTNASQNYTFSGNNWTPNNISLTAGTTYDSMIDSPTVSASSSNYAVLNPVGVPYNTGTAAGGNLNWTGATTADKGMAATISMDSGKWYWECTVTATAAGSNSYAGIVKTAGTSDVSANRVFYNGGGIINKYGTTTSGFSTFTTNDVIGVAYDYSAQTLAFYKNNTLVTTVTGINLEPNLPWVGGYTTTESWSVNFGQRPFTYTPPTGYSALNTYNLPTPTIKNGAQYMAATTYTGTGSSATINNGTNTTIGTTFRPDFLWIKDRSVAAFHDMTDVVRGVNNVISSNSTAAEVAGSFVTSFNSNGFTLPANTGTDAYYTNKSGDAFVAWQWNAGGTGVSNTSGTITSTVSANTTAGFSVVTWTGNGANATVGHGLGVAPQMIIWKNRSAVGTWVVGHTSLTSWGYYLALQSTAAQTADSQTFNNTAPTSSVFSIGTYNNNGQNFVAYCFAPVRGYSAFGSYTGNGSTDGPFVYTGFRPRWFLFKNASTISDWPILDTSRDTYNQFVPYSLVADTSGAESSSQTWQIDALSNGFKIRNSSTTLNGSGNTIIYAAFAENPFNYSRAR